ncbi:RNA-binding region-containing protein 3-like isoform X2 [Gigantopelta aegis]|uniref:RNA-binding region-containing protein 3-like isoform X2 n=1 Tax=Gigantopelta aegis TaxID=1735272 RepID=UPI001B889807|nr:RNA-binding region-containing protein 3-like isoform X2 [Gigantopelta aegis]
MFSFRKFLDKKDLLCHFGANDVRVMGVKGSLKHAAFAEFEDNEAASNALSRLHQLEVAGSRLVVEFANTATFSSVPELEIKPKDKILGSDLPVVSETKKTKREEFLNSFKDDVFEKWGINYPRNPQLHYIYPPPNVSILGNITNALASHPKFYVQVLHLMNKLNIPAPFGSLTPTPPIPSDLPPERPPEPEIRNEEMNRSSSTESEIESASDTEHKAASSEPLGVKRPVNHKHKKVHKKIKLMPDTFEAGLTVPLEQATWKPNEVFEQTDAQGSLAKKIHMKLPSNIELKETTMEDSAASLEKDSVSMDENKPGFGKLEPVDKPQEEHEMDQGDSDEDPDGHVSSRELKKGRLSERQRKEMPVFRNYNRGEASCRLYIKNLAKHVGEKDLKYIYGRYVNLELEEHRNIFDVRLMKEGRMKGQAFVTLPSEQAATEAVEDTNGFVLLGKPIVCQFARSAKVKEKESSGK